MKKLLLIMTMASIAFSCVSDDELLSNDQINTGPKIIGFQNRAENIAYFSDEGVVVKDIAVKLIGLGDGSLTSTDVELEYEIDAANTTAIEGTEYSFTDTSRKVTLSAGSTFATIKLNVNTGQLNPTEKTVLVLKLKPVDGFTVSDANQTITILFVGCATNLVGTYTRGARTATITKIAPNEYYSDYFPTFSAYYWFTFTDVCGELQITDWQFQGGNPITGTTTDNVFGFVSPNGNITFEHANVAGVSIYVDLTWTLVKQ